ncbi:MAG: class I SAM-dependent methyltransferase [Myxococcales bacterium]|nr:class I SAM-dependent methyltransferase [Myxococcales bacterium]MCB9521481.1 class I SAM-dependent methyltransferase [Myxococcales bacterium]MCB9531763.1 class I SAM-dependent methyltransferase [Myxococcales bacterium]
MKPLQFIRDGRRGTSAASAPDLPVFMNPIEFAQLATAAHAVAPKRVLEWGSGGSTAAMLRLLPTVESYVSIEHNREWFERVRSLVKDPRLDLRHAAPSEPEPVISERLSRPKRTAALKAWFARCEDEPALMADYVALPGSIHTSYDFVLVDGRARNACMRAGYALLRSGGVMVIHDAQRPEYRETIESYPHHLFIEPWVQGQICVIPKP